MDILDLTDCLSKGLNMIIFYFENGVEGKEVDIKLELNLPRKVECVNRENNVVYGGYECWVAITCSVCIVAMRVWLREESGGGN